MEAVTCDEMKAHLLDYNAYGAYTRSYLCGDGINGDKFSCAGFDSDKDFSSVPLGVSVRHSTGRHVHADDRDGSITSLLSPRRWQDS